MKGVITIAYNNLEKSIETKNILVEKLNKAGFEISENIEENTELIISIGGDGSFLNTVHKFDFVSIPIVAINTGHLGFFAELSPEKIDEFIVSYKNESIKLKAVNEIVIKNIQSRTVHLDLQVDGIKIEHFSGDGMLISTPMGSTAYNYSAGGSIVYPSLSLLQLTPIAPMNTNAYRSFTSSIILPTTSVISISPEFEFENSILIVVDGIEYNFAQIEEVKIYKSDKNVKLLRLNGYEFWDRVSEKFL